MQKTLRRHLVATVANQPDRRRHDRCETTRAREGAATLRPRQRIACRAGSSVDARRQNQHQRPMPDLLLEQSPQSQIDVNRDRDEASRACILGQPSRHCDRRRPGRRSPRRPSAVHRRARDPAPRPAARRPATSETESSRSCRWRHSHPLPDPRRAPRHRHSSDRAEVGSCPRPMQPRARAILRAIALDAPRKCAISSV